MKFRAGGLEFNATVAESSESRSPQTGDMLRSLTIQFRAQKATMHEQALEEAEQRQSGGLFSLSEADQPELEWRVRESRSTFVGTEPWGINHHVWRIEQVERLACEILRIGAVELEPYDYVEEASDAGVVRLAARALISESDLETLSHMLGAVDVVRVGITDTPRRMLLSYVWGERPEALAVVVQCEDAREPQVTLQGMVGIRPDDVLNDLLETLQTRGVLQQADLEHLRQGRHAVRRVSDVEAWNL